MTKNDELGNEFHIAATLDEKAPTGHQLSPVAEEVDKLKQLVVALKKKQEQTVKLLLEAEEETQALKGQQTTLKNIIESTRQQNEQLQQENANTIKRYHLLTEDCQKLERGQDAVFPLRQELEDQKLRYLELNQRLEEHQEQNSQQRLKLDKLAAVLREKEKRITDLQQFEYSYRRASEQKHEFAASLERESGLLSTLQRDTEQLQSELEESRRHNEQQERVIVYLRERSEEAHLETRQLQQELQRRQEALDQLQLEKNQLREELRQSQAVSVEMEQLKNNFAQLKTKTIHAQQELKKRESALLETTQILERIKEEKGSVDQHVEELNRQKEFLNQEIIQLKHSREESISLQKQLEEGLKEARQHDAWLRQQYAEAKSLAIEEQQHRQNLQQELDNLNDQMEQLQRNEEQLKKGLEEAEGKMAQLEQEKNSSNLQIQQKQEEMETLHREYALAAAVRDSDHMEALRNHQQKFDALQASHEELTLVQVQKGQLLEKYEQLKEEFHLLNDRLDEALEIRQTTENHNELLNQHLKESQNQASALQGHLEELQKEADGLKEQLEHQQHLNDDKETRLKIAQQHLAKKVKESTLLNDEMRDKEEQIIQLKEDNHNQIERLEFQRVEYERQRERVLQLEDALQQQVKASEEHLNKWEDKYFAMSKRHQEAEAKWLECQTRLTDLEKLEEKYAQMQAFLVNFGSFMGMPSGFNPASNPLMTANFPKEELKDNSFRRDENSGRLNPLHSSEDSSESQEGVEDQKASQPGLQLFDTSQFPSNKSRKTLFD